MSTGTSIEWTDTTWNPTRGCSRVSEGCRHCYAERQAARFSDPGQYAHGFVERTSGGPRWTGKVELVEDKLRDPLRWRKPQRVFVNSMSDLFHQGLTDEAIDRVLAVMALAPKHTFQVLTKRPERMRAYIMRRSQSAKPWHDAARSIGYSLKFEGQSLVTFPLANVWLGVSVEDQATADARIPILLDTPAAVRFVSAEPLLGPVDLRIPSRTQQQGLPWPQCAVLDWVIVGGESGPGARPCDVGWVRSIVKQCKAAPVACFVKQLGADWARARNCGRDPVLQATLDSKGGEPEEWPDDLRVREFPREAVRP